jgi:hypothetical protein
MNENYTFYYDETNNIRKFHLKEDGYNSSLNTIFVLGGVMHKNIPSNSNVKKLFEDLELQKTIKEVKLKHLTKGDFIKSLKSKKLNHYLKWLYNSDLYIHYYCLNLLYYSIVDIVDSAIANSKEERDLLINNSRSIKNSLYIIIKNKKEKFENLFFKYGYPDIKREDIRDFTKNLLSLIEESMINSKLNKELIILKQILNKSFEEEKLIFLTEENENVLINDFLQFYLRPLYMFKNSNHIFDNEDKIESLFQDVELKYYGKTLNNYRFLDSLSSDYIQISDVFVGLVGKFAMFINSKNVGEIKEKIEALNTLQKENFKLFKKIINKSEKMNKALISAAVSDNERKKYDELLSINTIA